MSYKYQISAKCWISLFSFALIARRWMAPSPFMQTRKPELNQGCHAVWNLRLKPVSVRLRGPLFFLDDCALPVHPHPPNPSSPGSILRICLGKDKWLHTTQNKLTPPALAGTLRNRAHLDSDSHEGASQLTAGNICSKRKNPTSITSACFQPLVTTQKVLSGSITPLLGLAQR